MRVVTPLVKLRYRFNARAIGPDVVIQRLKHRITAGGPGSGRHPYGSLKPPMTQESAKQLYHPSWVKHQDWKQQAYGGVLVNKDGQFLLREPTGHFDGYTWTWPKGKQDSEDEHPVDTATREVGQETGYKAGISDILPGTYVSGSGSHSSFYIMHPTGFDPSQMDNETRQLRWVDYAKAKELISRSKNKAGRARDLAILEHAHRHLGGMQAGGPGSGCHGPNCGRPAGPPLSKSTIDKILKSTGWYKHPEKQMFHFNGKLVKSKKWIYTHPVHGTMAIGPTALYHSPKNVMQWGTKTEHATGLIPLLNKLNDQSKGVTTPAPIPIATPTEAPAPAETKTNTAPEVSTTPVATGPSGIKPSDFTFKENGAALGGAHEKYVYTDKNGGSWLFKPATTIGGQSSPLMAKADEAVSKIAMAVRPGYAVEAHSITMDVPGKGPTDGSIQKMVSLQYLRGDGKFKDFNGRDLNSNPLQDWETKHLQQEQVLDWLVSNHDAHAGQFLRTTGQYVGSRSVIGIDKSQAFKFFGNDKLSTDYHPNTQEKLPFYNQMWDQVKAGKQTWNPEDALPTIKNAEGISDKDYKALLTSYANARFGSDSSAAKNDKDSFLDEAVDRKNNLRSDFEKFYSGILGKKFEFEPKVDPNAVAVVDVKGGKKPEVLPDHEERPNSKDILQTAIPDVLNKYSGAAGGKAYEEKKDNLNDSTIHAWQKAFNTTSPTMPDAQRWQMAAQGKGAYPELAAKVGLLPSDLAAVKQAIGNWKGSTYSEGANAIRAGAQDIMSGSDKLKSRFSAALQIEHEVTKAKLAQLYPSGLELYRGLTSDVATALKKAAKTSGMVEYNTMGAEGWSDHKGTGASFGSGGVILHATVPTANIITSYKTSPDAMHSYMTEAESIVAFPNKKMYLKASQIIGASTGIVLLSMKQVVDGTKQSHRAFPPKTKKSSGKPVVLEVTLLDKTGKPLLKK